MSNPSDFSIHYCNSAASRLHLTVLYMYQCTLHGQILKCTWLKKQEYKERTGIPETERVTGYFNYLTISYIWISKSISCQDSPQSSNTHLILERRVFWQGAVQIPLYLFRSKVILPHRFLHQVLIIARMSGHFINGSWEWENSIKTRRKKQGLADTVSQHEDHLLLSS